MKKLYFAFLGIVLLSGCLKLGPGPKTDTNIAGTYKGVIITSFTSMLNNLEPDEATTLILKVKNNIDDTNLPPADNITAYLFNYGSYLINENPDFQVLPEKYLGSGDEAAFYWDMKVDSNEKIRTSTVYYPKAQVCYNYENIGTTEILLTNSQWNGEIPLLTSSSTIGPVKVSIEANSPIRGSKEDRTLSINVESLAEGFITSGTGTDSNYLGAKNYINNLSLEIQTEPVPGQGYVINMPMYDTNVVYDTNIANRICRTRNFISMDNIAIEKSTCDILTNVCIFTEKSKTCVTGNNCVLLDKYYAGSAAHYLSILDNIKSRTCSSSACEIQTNIPTSVAGACNIYCPAGTCSASSPLIAGVTVDSNGNYCKYSWGTSSLAGCVTGADCINKADATKSCSADSNCVYTTDSNTNCAKDSINPLRSIGYFECSINNEQNKWTCTIPICTDSNCNPIKPNNFYLIQGNREFKTLFNTIIPYQPYEQSFRITAKIKYKHCVTSSEELKINIVKPSEI